MKLLFMPYPSTSGTWGCTINMLATAREADSRGHEVVFHACPPSSRILLDNHFRVREFTGVASADRLTAVRDIYDVFTSLGADDAEHWRALLAVEHDVIRDERPDVIIQDMRPTASISARRHGTPLVAMASIGTDPRLQARPDDHRLDELARRIAGTASGPRIATMPELLFWTAERKIAPSFAAFEPELRDVPGLDYVGYLDSTNRRGLDHLPPRPSRLVVAYLSTVGWRSDIMVRSLSLAARLAGVTIWCVTNANGRAEEVDDRLRLFDYLPLDELLPECSALLFHGGRGTALASLSHGIPTIACPGRHYEREYNADRLQELGCGIHASVMDMRPQALSRLISLVVDEPIFAAAAQSAGSLMRDLPRSAGAVDIIERVAAQLT